MEAFWGTDESGKAISIYKETKTVKQGYWELKARRFQLELLNHREAAYFLKSEHIRTLNKSVRGQESRILDYIRLPTEVQQIEEEFIEEKPIKEEPIKEDHTEEDHTEEEET